MRENCTCHEATLRNFHGTVLVRSLLVSRAQPMRNSRPSLTAIKVSRILLYLDRDPKIRPLLPKGAAEATERLLLAAGLVKPWMIDFYRAPTFRRMLAWMEQRTEPGAALHLGLRKRFFDDETRAAIAQGARQVLVIGAGFDTLCTRLAPEYPGVRFVEIDHPATQAAKRRAMDSLAIHPSNLSLISANLAVEPLDRVLAGVGAWNEDETTAVLAEALFMYLAPAAVSTLLEAIGRATKVGSRLLFTYVKANDRGKPLSRSLGWLTRLSLRLMGEPLLWFPAEGELATFLEAHAYRLDQSPERCDLRLRYLKPAGLADRAFGRVESMAIADTLFRPDS